MEVQNTTLGQLENGYSDFQPKRPSTAPEIIVTLPQADEGKDVLQDAEIVEVVIKQRIRIHDYNTLYAYPGLYDHVIEEKLKCQSPQFLVSFLKEHLFRTGPAPESGPLSILDVAAGSGRVGVELRRELSSIPGIQRLAATDLVKSAELATSRDRNPTPYDQYITGDLIALSQENRLATIFQAPLDVIIVCAALGPGDGDMPLEVIDVVIGLLKVGGLLLLTVNEALMGDKGTRHHEFLKSVSEERSIWKSLMFGERKRYRHRLNIKREWIEYAALVYTKVSV